MGDITIKYIDKRPIFIPPKMLRSYPNGVILPDKKNTISVTEKESLSLLKHRNGQRPCYELVQKEQKKNTEEK